METRIAIEHDENDENDEEDEEDENEEDAWMILTFMQIGMRLVEVDPRFVLELIPTSKLPNTDAVALLKLLIITSILFCLQFVLEFYRTQLPSLHLLPVLALISIWIKKILT